MSQSQATSNIEREHAENSETPVADRATERAHEVVDKAGQRAANMERNVREGAANTQERLQDGKEAATERMDESMATVEDFIQRKPLASAGIAFAAGVLVSRLLSK